MFKQWSRYQLLIMCVVLVFGTTACFRDNAEGVGVQPVAQLIPTEEPTDVPTEVEATEEVEVTDEVELTEEVAIPTETSTPTPTVTASVTPTPTLTEVVVVATETMTIDPLLLRLTKTDEPEDSIVNIGNTSPGGTAVAQAPTAEEQPDDFALTATALIGQLTQDAAIIATTQAFEAGIGVTETPILPPTTDPFLVTPTVVQSQGIIPGQDCVHQIRAGETLYKLSLAYGVSVSEMQAASNIANANLILIGTRVTIPSCGTTGFTPPATSVPVPTATTVVGDTQASAQSAVTGAGTSTTTTDTLAAQAQQDIINNAQADIQANAIAQGAAPATGSQQYTVQQYDTLYQIAQSFGTTVDAIAALNGITNINSITMGDVLQIP